MIFSMNGGQETRRFEDQVVVITESTKGIGKEIAKQFAAESTAAGITGRTTTEGEAVADSISDAGGTAVFVEADMRPRTISQYYLR